MTEGPKLQLRASCFACRYCRTESYEIQSDSGSIVICSKEKGKRIGDTSWKTPDWCPFLKEAKQEFMYNLAAEIQNE